MGINSNAGLIIVVVALVVVVAEALNYTNVLSKMLNTQSGSCCVLWDSGLRDDSSLNKPKDKDAPKHGMTEAN